MGVPSKPPHQNFTVLVPSSIEKGPAQLGVFHVSLVGVSFLFWGAFFKCNQLYRQAGPEPFSEVLNITLVIQ